MKKIIAIALVMLVAISVTACSMGKDNGNPNSTNAPSSPMNDNNNQAQNNQNNQNNNQNNNTRNTESMLESIIPDVSTNVNTQGQR